MITSDALTNSDFWHGGVLYLYVYGTRSRGSHICMYMNC